MTGVDQEFAQQASPTGVILHHQHLGLAARRLVRFSANGQGCRRRWGECGGSHGRQGQDFFQHAAKLGPAEALFAQAGVRPKFTQDADRQFDGGETRKQDGRAGRIAPAQSLQHPQAILVAMVSARKREVHHRQPVRGRPQQCRGRLVAAGHIRDQPGVGQQLGQNLLPGGIIFDDESAGGCHAGGG